ncbi:hypothetical protein BCM02_102712 [Paenibacillus methanolicus]|uniref:Uncharacterized protein n=1 Tax=Paenibacillus methanolicus TaxID=582686 RepID=A0A5S5CFM8_9BACL|nr:hypothetical protein BCM02_102712 [Paenibacillus methanolicus]
MWGVTAVLAAGAMIFAFEVPALFVRRSRRAWAAFLFLLTAGISILLCIAAGVAIPSPLEPLRMIFEPVGRAIRGE